MLFRSVQEALLKAGARLQPYLDLEPSSPDFLILQRIGSTGIMRGKGETIGWSNEMRFRTSANLLKNELFLEDYYGIPHDNSTAAHSGATFVALIEKITQTDIDTPLRDKSTITRLEAARFIDEALDPFHTFNVSLNGDVQQ